MFGPLKKHLASKVFHNKEKVKLGVKQWLAQVGENFYRYTIFNLVARSDKCNNKGGTYVEL